MPKFQMKHGCCYIPPTESESQESATTTCQVFANPDFDYTVSDALCTVGKSSPEFANNRKQISWGYLDHLDDIAKPQSSRSPCDESEESHSHHSHHSHHTHEHSTVKKTQESHENCEENFSLFTIYGNRTRHAAYDSDKNINERPDSEVSIYKPTSIHMPNPQVSSSEKFLDCISMCLWKCSSWCQKIE